MVGNGNCSEKFSESLLYLILTISVRCMGYIAKSIYGLL
jgi:hypothetical protein